jgi:tRNA dimethylallyltransferase
MNLTKDLKSFLKSAKNPLVVILGPTASGKTAISLKIAKEIDGEIISTDSRQIYRGLEIGSDVLPEDQQEGIPHHMIGIVDPDREYSLAEYKDDAEKVIAEIRERDHVPMLVGGTGLYISALTEEYDVPRVPPDKELREKLYKEAEKKGGDHLHARLAKLDPEAAAQIHPNNLRYVVRALEINLKTGKPKQNQKAGSTKPNPEVFMLGIERPREEIYERINTRVDTQDSRGLIDEVTALLDKGYDEELPAMSSLGVKEIIPFICKEQTLEECKETLKQNTRNYAKRQGTWFRRYPQIHWIKAEDLPTIL